MHYYLGNHCNAQKKNRNELPLTGSFKIDEGGGGLRFGRLQLTRKWFPLMTLYVITSQANYWAKELEDALGEE